MGGKAGKIWQNMISFHLKSGIYISSLSIWYGNFTWSRSVKVLNENKSCFVIFFPHFSPMRSDKFMSEFYHFKAEYGRILFATITWGINIYDSALGSWINYLIFA